MKTIDMFDNFYYNLRNVKSLKVLENEVFVDYPRIFMEEYKYNFPRYDKLKHYNNDFTGFCLFTHKKEVLPRGAHDHSFVYMKDGEFKFFQKSSGICDRMQIFYDDNYHVRKDFFVDSYEFLPEDYGDPDLEDDDYTKIIIDNKLKELPKTSESRRGNFNYSKDFRAGLDQFNSTVSYILQGGFSKENKLILSFDVKRDSRVLDFLDKNISIFEDLGRVVSMFGNKKVHSEVFFYNGDGSFSGREVFDEIKFSKAFYYMTDPKFVRL